MHLVVEHVRLAPSSNIIEISCPPAFREPVKQAIQKVIGRPPVTVEFPGELLYLTDLLTMEEGQAILELVVDLKADPALMSREAIRDHLAGHFKKLGIEEQTLGLDAYDFCESEVGD